MKRKIISFGIILAMMGSLVLFSSAKSVDERLVTATKITRKILNVDVKDDKEKCGYISSNYVKGLDGVEDYIISQCATGGYAIFEKESMELIEYSGVGQSPYVGVENNNAYYGGPVNYFKGKDGKIENLNTGKISNKENSKEIANELKRKLKEDREKRKEKAKIQIQTNNLSSPGPTGEHVADADSYTVRSRKYIPNYQFFVNNREHGENKTGTCTTIAVQLLLAYNNWANDGRLIPANPKQGIQFLPSGRDAEQRIKIYSNLMRSTTSDNLDTDNITTFYECLLSYIDKNEDGASLTDASDGIMEYIGYYALGLQDQITIRYDFSVFGEWRERFCTALKSEVDHSRPAIASINTYETQSDGTVKVSGHAIVVYGYQTIQYESQEINGFIAHYGWHDRDTTNVWVNSSWFRGYLTFQTNHTHNNENVLEPKNHVFECGECNAVYAKDNHIREREKTSKLDASDTYYSVYHEEECICGYKSQQLHEFEYEWFNTAEHKATCVLCGYEELSFHFAKFDYCNYCQGPIE